MTSSAVEPVAGIGFRQDSTDLAWSFESKSVQLICTPAMCGRKMIALSWLTGCYPVVAHREQKWLRRPPAWPYAWNCMFRCFPAEDVNLDMFRLCLCGQVACACVNRSPFDMADQYVGFPAEFSHSGQVVTTEKSLPPRGIFLLLPVESNKLPQLGGVCHCGV